MGFMEDMQKYGGELRLGMKKTEFGFELKAIKDDGPAHLWFVETTEEALNYEISLYAEAFMLVNFELRMMKDKDKDLDIKNLTVENLSIRDRSKTQVKTDTVETTTDLD